MEKIGEESVTRRMKYLQQSKQHLRKMFMNEYVHALVERQLQNSKQKHSEIPKVGAVVVLKGDTKDKALWKIGRVISWIKSRDGVTRGLKIKQGNGFIVERPLQLVCDLEVGGENSQSKPNPNAESFVPREYLERGAKKIAEKRIKQIYIQEAEED